MFTVTEAAGAHLADLLKAQQSPEGIAVRFICEAQGIALRADSEREGDTAFKYQEQTVLLLDGQVSEMLGNSTLDMDGAQLALCPAETK